MKTYYVTIKPQSAFGTPMKGDTIFGSFCWQVAEDPSLAEGGLDHWIKCYGDRPFAVFSSAWPIVEEGDNRVYTLRRPELPSFIFGDPEDIHNCEERLKHRKENKARKWFVVSQDLRPELCWDNLIDDRALHERVVGTLAEEPLSRYGISCGKIEIRAEQQHNTINRETMTTGKGMFAPYPMENRWYLPGMEMVIFMAVDEEACTPEQIGTALKRMGQWGFGRDASTGLGRFSVEAIEKINWPEVTPGDAMLTLAPCVPEAGRFRERYFTPFIRFGRHGAQLLHTGKPFKNPVVMADEGAVFVPQQDDIPDRPYIGQAITGISKALPATVAQGYSLVLPFAMPS